MAKRNELTAKLPALAAWLGERIERPVTIESISAGPSGLSNATYFLDVNGLDDEPVPLVLRMAPEAFSLLPDADLALQFDIPAVLSSLGVPVAGVRWIETDKSVLGAPFLIMDFVEGDVCSDRAPGYHGAGLFFDRDDAARRALWFATVDAMADLHRVARTAVSSLPSLGTPSSPREAVLNELTRIEGWLNWVGREDVTLLRETVTWLRAHCPTPADLTVCWGDAKIGNVMYRDGNVAALLDWELAHLGPPEIDLGYFLLVDEVSAHTHSVPRLINLPDAAETIARWEARIGRDAEDFDYYRVFAALRLASLLVLTDRLAVEMGWNFFPPDFLTNNLPVRVLTQHAQARKERHV